MPCEEVKSAKYQTRKSPPFHAKDCKGLTKQGKDGSYVSTSDAKGIYKWIKANATRKSPKGEKRYRILHNGNKPFQVTVSGKTVGIYKGDRVEGDDYDEHRNYNELIKKLTVKAVYPGETPVHANMWINEHTAVDKGNSVILHVKGDHYIYVGSDIYEFTMEDDIIAYYSPIGPNDVPYPVVIGTKYVYFMLDRTYMSKEIFTAKMTPAEWADAYAYYYGNKDYATGETINCFEKYRTNIKKRKQCQQEHNNIRQKREKDAIKHMKGVKLLARA